MKVREGFHGIVTRMKEQRRREVLKRCPDCGLVKPVGEFYAEPRKKNAVSHEKVSWAGMPETHRPTSRCKDCTDRRHRLGTYKYNAKLRGLSFKLTKEQFYELLNQDCHYCGATPTLEALKVNGIDRIDSQRGYEVGNVVPCCKTCNYAKNKSTPREWEDYLRRLVTFRLKQARRHREQQEASDTNTVCLDE